MIIYHISLEKNTANFYTQYKIIKFPKESCDFVHDVHFKV